MLDQLAAEVHVLEAKVAASNQGRERERDGQRGRKGVEDEPPEEGEGGAAAATAASATALEGDGDESVDDENDGDGVVLQGRPSVPDALDHPRGEHSGWDEGKRVPCSCLFAANDQESQGAKVKAGRPEEDRPGVDSSHQAGKCAEPLDDNSRGTQPGSTAALVHDPKPPPRQVDSGLATVAADATPDTGKEEHRDENGPLRRELREATTLADNFRGRLAAPQRS